MCIDDPTIGRRRTYDEIALEVLVVLGCFYRASPFGSVPVFLMTKVIHLVSSLTYRDTIISDAGHGQILCVTFVGAIQRNKGTHFPYISGHPVEVSSVMGSVKATVVNMIPEYLGGSLHSIHARY